MVCYTVYKTTNNANGKFYVGVHKTTRPDDNYLGSGKVLKRAIKKYGIANFSKEVLFIFSDYRDAYEKEAEIVNSALLAEECSYNLKIGGRGGFDFVNSLEATKLARSANGKVSANLSIARKSAKFAHPSQILGMRRAKRFTGKTHNLETKIKMSEIAATRVGKKNSQFGSIWITNGVEVKKIKDASIPTGWRRGRK